MVKVLLTILGIFTGLLILLELALRLLLGLGNPPLYLPEPEIGYLLAPNQDVYRFGNQISINQYSMRNKAIASQRPPDTLRILLLGDSIANGAWWTDQKETISALMEQDLGTAHQKNRFSKVEVLNASANSWGPRNQLAYLKRFGTFEAQIVVVLMNTDDLFATAPTSIPVGREPNYPAHKPILALVEGFNRLFVRPQSIPEMALVNAEKGDRVGLNLAALQEIRAIAAQNQGKFLIAITPLKREMDNQRDYEQKARERLKTWTKTQDVPYLDFLPIFEKVEHPVILYRDHIHLSPKGNKLVSNTLSQLLSQKMVEIN